jgi:hypothetical protein
VSDVEYNNESVDEVLWGEIANGPVGLHCEGCDLPYATNNRQNTQYGEDALNYARLCPTCQEDTDAYWAERWADYYGAVWLKYGCPP